MTKVPISDPKHWREGAEEARAAADNLTDPDSKSRMLSVAEVYDELAGHAERRLHRARQAIVAALSQHSPVGSPLRPRNVN